MRVPQKAVVSGAGITGVVAALYCNSRGVQSEIHESRPETGGILRDWTAGGHWFYRNCQYLSPQTEWFGLLPQARLFHFPLTYGSYTDLWGEPCPFRGFAGPVYSLKTKLGPLRNWGDNSLRERILAYPEPIAQPLLAWAMRFGIEPGKIHSSGALGLQASRIFPMHFATEIKSLKAADRNAEELYGLPRPFFGLAPVTAALPQEGFSAFFRDIEKELGRLRVPLNLNSAVKPAEALRQKLPGTAEAPHAVVWTGNPIPLVRSLCARLLDAPSFKMRNIAVRWAEHCFNPPFYIQVFSKNLPITRIFVYFNKATIECLNDGTNALEVLSSALGILESFDFKNLPKPEEAFEFFETRHFLCSVDDFSILESIVTDQNSDALVPSPWHRYGRNAKIQAILECLDRKFGIDRNARWN